jgi:protein-S-isoprenylcysteine O-methyltransferase Ste14
VLPIDRYFIGTFLINGTLFFLIAALIVVFGIHYQILQEEKFLDKNYGQSYQDYCNSVARYFTWKRAKGLNSN